MLCIKSSKLVNFVTGISCLLIIPPYFTPLPQALVNITLLPVPMIVLF